MITVNPVVLPHHVRADGSCPVKIRISCNRSSAYLPTNIIADKKELSNGKLKAGCPSADNVSGLLRDVRRIVSEIPFAEAESISASDVVKYVKRKMKEKDGFRLDFIAYMHRIADTKTPGSAGNYHAAANALARYIGQNELDISRITARFLRDFEAFLRDEPNRKGHYGQPSVRKASQYLACVRHVHKKARQDYNEPDIGIMRIPYSPFEFYKVPRQNPPKHRNKSINIIQKMIDEHRNLQGRERLGVDVFLISFSLIGMNVPDLYSAKEPVDGIITYNRQKTHNNRQDGAEMRVRIESCALPLLEGYLGTDGYAFNFRNRYANFNSVTRNANIGLKAWLERVRIPAFTLYSARHSWGTIANSKLCKIDKAVVNDSLCHVDPDMKVTDIYVEKDWDLIWEANKTVLALFDWSRI